MNQPPESERFCASSFGCASGWQAGGAGRLESGARLAAVPGRVMTLPYGPAVGGTVEIWEPAAPRWRGGGGWGYCLISSMMKHSKISPSLISLYFSMAMPHS